MSTFDAEAAAREWMDRFGVADYHDAYRAREMLETALQRAFEAGRASVTPPTPSIGEAGPAAKCSQCAGYGFYAVSVGGLFRGNVACDECEIGKAFARGARVGGGPAGHDGPCGPDAAPPTRSGT